ncbi:hypothetical protein LJR267_010476 [Paraburkholderia hospita]|uniref:hypothetical protein n=1 Tax=Paraburkholderia hospita TaxID=169430 RepID=UPI003ED02F15
MPQAIRHAVAFVCACADHPITPRRPPRETKYGEAGRQSDDSTRPVQPSCRRRRCGSFLYHADLALGSIRAAPDDLYQQQLFLHSFVTMVSVRNEAIGESITREQFESMPQIAVSLTGRARGAYDSAFDEYGINRNVYLTTPHFLVVPLLIDEHPELIATVPLELGNVFAKLGTVKLVPPPVALPPFALRQHWHPRFHDEPGNIWLRQLIKRTFERYPNLSGCGAIPMRRSVTLGLLTTTSQ